MTIESYLEERRALVNNFLRECLKKRRERILEVLFDSMEYSLAGGKGIRPILVLAGCELLGGSPEEVLPTAAALECFHAYSLIHDDLPAMDDAEFRHGKPATHKEFGEAVAILAGDSLLAWGFELIVCEQAKLSKLERVLEILKLAASALGVRGLCGGQLLDLGFHQEDEDERLLKEIYSLKTGKLLEVAAMAGAILKGGSPKQVESLKKFGGSLGLAYQVIDDILDAESYNAKGKLTLPRLLGKEKARAEAERLTEEAIRALDIFGGKADKLKQVAKYLLVREY